MIFKTNNGIFNCCYGVDNVLLRVHFLMDVEYLNGHMYVKYFSLIYILFTLITELHRVFRAVRKIIHRRTKIVSDITLSWA